MMQGPSVHNNEAMEVHPANRARGKGLVRVLGSRHSKDALLGVALVLPALLVICLIVVRPLVTNLWQSLFRIDLQSAHQSWEYVGLKNYRLILTSRYVQEALRNSVFLTVSATGLDLLIGFSLVVLMNKPFPGRGIVRTFLILPWAVPPIVAAFAWRFLADPSYGMFNRWLLGAGLISAPINWLAYPNSTWLILIAANVWKGLPFMFLTFDAGMKQIPNELYDAAKVDGASAMGVVRHVIIPGIRNVAAIAIVLRAIWYFNWFDLVWLLTGGGPGRATEIMPLIAYRTAFREFSIGRASAVSSVMFMVLLLLVLAFFRYRRQYEQEEC